MDQGCPEGIRVVSFLKCTPVILWICDESSAKEVVMEISNKFYLYNVKLIEKDFNLIKVKAGCCQDFSCYV